ncbi:MAG: hypothetical protein ACYDAE_14490 [Steroidobacteraceae bacterium]
MSAQDAASAITRALTLVRAGCPALASEQLRKALEALKPGAVRCTRCGGGGLDEDGHCEACDGSRVEPGRASRVAGAAFAAVLTLTGCATCERYPVACTAAVAIIGTSVVLSLRHHDGPEMPPWLSGCLAYYRGKGASPSQAATACR